MGPGNESAIGALRRKNLLMKLKQEDVKNRSWRNSIQILRVSANTDMGALGKFIVGWFYEL